MMTLKRRKQQKFNRCRKWSGSWLTSRWWPSGRPILRTFRCRLPASPPTRRDVRGARVQPSSPRRGASPPGRPCFRCGCCSPLRLIGLTRELLKVQKLGNIWWRVAFSPNLLYNFFRVDVPRVDLLPVCPSFLSAHIESNQRMNEINKVTKNKEQMNKWTNEQTNKERKNKLRKQTNEQRTKEQMNKQTNEQTNKQTNEQKSEWTSAQIFFLGFKTKPESWLSLLLCAIENFQLEVKLRKLF